jgi:hypothetical protein
MDMKANAAGIESNKAACCCAITANFRKPADGSAIDQPYRGERGCLNNPADIHSVASPAMAATAAVSLHLHSHPMFSAISMISRKMKSGVSGCATTVSIGKLSKSSNDPSPSDKSTNPITALLLVYLAARSSLSCQWDDRQAASSRIRT